MDNNTVIERFQRLVESRDRMDDDEWKAHLETIEDPVEMLGQIVINSEFLGGDPYYRDLVQAMVSNAERVVALCFSAEQVR